MRFLRAIGRAALRFLAAAGRLAIFTVVSLSYCLRPPIYVTQILRQMVEIGYYSLPVVGLTTLFTGMVLTVQTADGFGDFSDENAVATIVVLSVTRELAPVLAGLMVAGRIGASMAAEIGTMRVTEQIDALTTLATNPYRYLIVPRLIAGTAMLPLLVLIGNIIGIFGGFLIAVYELGYSGHQFIARSWDALETIGVLSGLVKAAVFGFLIALMGCYHGFHSKGGAQGVGMATTNSVVSASILILCFNYIITGLFFAA